VIRSVLVACLLASAVYADDAKSHFKQGKAYEEAGAFARAAEEFEAAYALDPRAEILFDIAQAYRLAGNRQRAIDNFRRFLDAHPDGKAADEARVLVAELQRQIDEARATEPPPAPPPEPAHPAPLVERPTATVLVRASPPLRIAGLVAVGGGAIAIGLGIKFGLDASSASSYFTHFSGTWSDADRQRYADGQTADRNMKIACGVGAGLVAAGAVAFWFGSRVQAVPVAGPQSVGVAMTGRW
jgi:tetratricopeptide (TPR) repeat protein